MWVLGSSWIVLAMCESDIGNYEFEHMMMFVICATVTKFNSKRVMIFFLGGRCYQMPFGLCCA